MTKRILLLCCIALASHAQRPLRWVADAAQTAPVTFDCSRGETLTFSPTLKAYGTTLTNYTASFQWQTNGMGTAFWSTNALVFTPSMDVGASRYRFWIRAETTNGVMYSAQGTINMLHAPGAAVNALPLPVQRIDFSTIIYTNAPWLLVESDPGIPAALVIADTNAQAKASAAQAAAIAVSASNTTAAAEAAIAFSRTNAIVKLQGTTNAWVSVVNGTAMTFRVTYPLNGLKVEGFNNPSVDGYTPPQNVYYTPLAGSRQIDMGNRFWCGLLDFSMGIGWLGDEYSIDAWTGGAFAPTTLVPNYPTAGGYWEVTLINLYPVTNTYTMVSTDMPMGLNAIQVTNIVEAVKELHIDSFTNIIWRSVYSNGWMWLVAYTNYPAN